MQLSKRLAATEFPPIAEAMSWVEGRVGTRDLLNMCQAVPSYPPAEMLQSEFARIAHLPNTGGYTEILGIKPLREAFAAHLSRGYGGSVSASEIGITSGCNQAFAAAVMAVAEPGDHVIMPSPWYFNHSMWLSMLGIEIQHISAFSETGAWPDVTAARKALNAKTRAIILCTPNNPTGAIYPPHVIEAFYELAEKVGIALILDETYNDFRPDNTPAHGLLSRKDGHKNLVQLYSFSKIYALAGYRLGALVAGPELMHQATKFLDTIAICPPNITQQGVIFALRELEEWKAGKKAIMAERLATIRHAFAQKDLAYQLTSSGAYFAYVRHPFKGQQSKSVAKRLAQEFDVLCLPGSMFGPHQEEYLRFAFANVEKEKMALLAERLSASERPV